MKQNDTQRFPLLIASDHAGFDLKSKFLEEKQFLWKDLGCFSKERTDYPDWADKLCEQLHPESTSHLSKEAFGVLICGTGQGMAIRANRWKHIRASLCWNEELAFLARNHNQANVLCLPGKFIDKNQALGILKVFLNAKISTEVAHIRRVKKLSL